MINPNLFNMSSSMQSCSGGNGSGLGQKGFPASNNKCYAAAVLTLLQSLQPINRILHSSEHGDIIHLSELC